MKKILITTLLVLLTSSVFAQYTAVRVNALGLATGSINAGVDVAVSDKWSVDVSGYWNPIATGQFRLKTLALTAGVRRWHFEPHVGLFWGVHLTAAQYKVGNNATQYNGWLTGVGSSVGYSWMLSKRWNFSLEGGLGLFYMEDTRWSPNTSPLDDVALQHYRRVVLAPSKLEISFSYLF